MKAVLEKKENNEAHFQFSIEAEKFEHALEKSYKKNVKKYDIPGFRKGKVTREVLEAKLGAEVFYQDALDLVVPKEYEASLKELALNPVGDPDIEVGYIEKGKPLSVKVVVPLMPEVTLGKIEGFEIKAPKKQKVTEENIEKYLEDMRSKNKRIIDKADEPAALGDTLTVDYKCTVGDRIYDDVNNYKFILDSESSFLGFEDQLAGAKKGDTLHIETSFPEDHAVDQIAGKKGQFEITVKQVENIQLKELNNQFAQEIGKVNNLEELRIKAKNELDEMAALRTSTALKQEIIKAMFETCDTTIPEFLVMQRAKDMLEQVSHDMEAQGGNLDLYLQMTGTNRTEFKNHIWEKAKEDTKAEYILDKIINEKGFEVSEEELDKGAENYADFIGMDKENARENLGPLINKVLFDLKVDKAIQYMIDHAIITIDE